MNPKTQPHPYEKTLSAMDKELEFLDTVKNGCGYLGGIFVVGFIIALGVQYARWRMQQP